MSAPFASLVLLAEDVSFTDLGRNFRDGGNGYNVTHALLALLVFAALGVVIWFVVRYMSQRERRTYNSPRRLFNELCYAHGFNRRERRLLQRLARGQRLDHPALLFVDPQYYQAPRLTDALAARHDQLLHLRDLIFGKRLEMDQPAETAPDPH